MLRWTDYMPGRRDRLLFFLKTISLDERAVKNDAARILDQSDPLPIIHGEV